MVSNEHVVKAPIAVIGFSDQASPLEPLWPGTHRALLPIVGKSLIVHLIEQLADAGIRHVRIAGSIQQYAVRNRLRCGREWGVTIRYSDLHGEDLLAEGLTTSDHCLYLIGDHLYDVDFRTIVESSSGRSEVLAELDTFEAGLWSVEDGVLKGYSLDALSSSPSYMNALTSVGDYHYVNLRALRGTLPRLSLPGAAFHRSAIADWQSGVSPDARIGKHVFIGKHSRVGGLARLDSDCVLANGVVVAGGAVLKSVSVLPNCYIGSRMSIRDVVLGPDGVLGLDGSFWPVRNVDYLGATRDNLERRTGLPDRIAAGSYALGRSAVSGSGRRV